MYKVQKRDGKVVKFDISKISDAMKQKRSNMMMM